MVARWYCVQARPNQETIARFNLDDQGFTTFLPECVTVIRHARKVSEVRRPLFPGYLFVEFDRDMPGVRWKSINSSRGVLRLVCTAGCEPIAARIGEVERIIELVDGGKAAIRIDESQMVRFKRGQRLRVTEGPFTSFSGPLIRSILDSVIVELDVFGRSTRVELPYGAVELAA